MTPARREKAVLAHSCANFPPEADPRQYNSAGAAPGCFAPNIPAHPPSCLAEAGKSHFARNGYKRAFKAFKGKRGRLGRESSARHGWRRLYGRVKLGSSAAFGFSA